ARYTTGKWSGDILAFDATSAGVAETPSWVASEEVPAWNARDIFTWDGSDGAEFPTTAQLALLDQSLRANGPVNAANNAEYIKGRQTLEAQNDNGTGAPEELRNRDSALADIVNSSPFYVAESDTLYVGSNSGMLHAFNASTGAEVFAYVPGSINFSRLATLSDPFYTHRSE